MIAQRLSVVSSEIPDPPYLPDTKANGWKPEQDIQRIKQSRTWVLCPPNIRPWLLMVWMEAWESVPVGTYPADDDEMIAARIGMDIHEFEVRRKVLMRGWYRCSDGNLYHPYLSEMIGRMLDKRTASRERKRAFDERQKEKAEEASNALQDQSNALRSVSNVGVTDRNRKQEQELGSSIELPLSEDDAEAPSSRHVAQCPHQKIVDLYHEVLPELPGIVLSLWGGSKDAAALKARWREDSRHQDLNFWRRFFEAVRTSNRWMGDNNINWKADLRWLVKKNNFIKVVEHMVNNQEVA